MCLYFFTLSGMIEGVGDLGACSFASPHPVYDHLFWGFLFFWGSYSDEQYLRCTFGFLNIIERRRDLVVDASF